MKMKISSEYERMLRSVIMLLKKKGYDTFQAALGGYKEPGQIVGHQPDIIAEDSKKKKPNLVMRVETPERMKLSHTASIWRVFAGWATMSDYKFIVAIPKEFKEIAEEWIADNNISTKVWTVK